MSLVILSSLLTALAGSAQSAPRQVFSAAINDPKGIEVSGVRFERTPKVGKKMASGLEPTLRLESRDEGALPFALWVGLRYRGRAGSVLALDADAARFGASALRQVPAGRLVLSGVKHGRRLAPLFSPLGAHLRQRWDAIWAVRHRAFPPAWWLWRGRHDAFAFHPFLWVKPKDEARASSQPSAMVTLTDFGPRTLAVELRRARRAALE